MKDAGRLLEFLNQRHHFSEVVTARPRWLGPLVHFKILGVKPVYSLLVRVPRLRDRFLEVDWKSAERIVEYPWLHRLLGRAEGVRTILDVGCSDSRASMELASLGYQVTGVDMRDYPVAHPNFRFVRGDVCRLPFRDGSFDFAACISTLEHVGVPSYGLPGFPDGDRAALREIRRCLRPGGLLYLTVPFGRRETTWQRIYDAEALRELLSGFAVIEARHYRRHEGKYWLEEAPEALEAVRSPSEEGANGVALRFLRKEGD